MRKTSKLHSLTGAERKYVASLCSKLPYDKVLEILAKPHSEGGFSLRTSRSALSRFFTALQPDPDRLAHEVERLMPLLDRTAANQHVFPGAIKALLEQYIFTQLAAHKPFELVEQPMRLLLKLTEQLQQQPPATASQPSGQPAPISDDAATAEIFRFLNENFPPNHPGNPANPGNPA